MYTIRMSEAKSNSSKRVKFEGAIEEIIRWLVNEGSKVFPDKGVQEVHIIRRPEGFRKEIKLANFDVKKRKEILEDEVTKDAHEIPSFKVVEKYKRGAIGPKELEVKRE